MPRLRQSHLGLSPLPVLQDNSAQARQAGQLVAWVEFDDPAERECGTKWSLCVKDRDDGCEGEDLIATEDETEFRGVVEAIVGVAEVWS